MKYEKQEMIQYDYVWSSIKAKLPKSAIDSYNQYTRDYNRATSTDTKEFLLDQRNKYLKECFCDYENKRLSTPNYQPINIQSAFNQDIARNLLAIPGTPDAFQFYGKEKAYDISRNLMIAKGEHTSRYLYIKDSQIVSSIVVAHKSKDYGLDENTITSAFTDPSHQKLGYASSLLVAVKHDFKSKLTVTPDLTESGVKLFKPRTHQSDQLTQQQLV